MMGAFGQEIADGRKTEPRGREKAITIKPTRERKVRSIIDTRQSKINEKIEVVLL